MFSYRRITTGLAAAGIAVLAVAGTTATALAAPSGPAPKAHSAVVQPDDGLPTNCNFTTSRPTLSLGSTGAAVKQAQCYLNDSFVNRTKLVVDGDFGSKTLSAVKAFQSCQHITVDGIVGPVTWSHLKESADSLFFEC